MASRSSDARNGKPTQSMYQPLLEQHKEIRLLLLHSAQDYNAPLRAELKHVSLHSAHFSALSYVWGQQEQHRSILSVSYARSWSPKTLFKSKTPAADSDFQLDIGSNLADALRCIRRRRKTITLWVDAICINQADGSEKSVQVAMMADIYTKADKVCAWLGPSRGETFVDNRSVKTAFEVCRKIWNAAQRVKERQDLDHEEGWLEACFLAAGRFRRLDDPNAQYEQSAWGEFSARLEKAIMSDSTILGPIASLEELSRLAWWSRIWILQESGRARNLQFYYGALSENYKVLLLGLSVAQGIHAMGRGTRRERGLDDLDARFHGCLTARTTRRRSFQEVLEVAYLAPPPLYGATDPRDLIYARRGLANDLSSADFTVVHEEGWDVLDQHGKVVSNEDLSQSDREARDSRRQHITGRVFARASRFLLERGTFTTLVTFKPYDFLWTLPLACYPSWAYDWSGKGLDTFTRYHASGDSRQQASFEARQSEIPTWAMRLTGVSLGEIRQVGRKFSRALEVAGIGTHAVLKGTLHDADFVTDPLQMQSLVHGVRKNYHGLNLTISDIELEALTPASRHPVLLFFYWWSSWIAQLEALRGEGTSHAAQRQHFDSVAELVLREVTGTGAGGAVQAAFGGAGTSLALLDLGRWWLLLFHRAPEDLGGKFCDEEITFEGMEILDDFFRGAWGMRPASLEEGHLAYVPEDCESQDEVVIFHGVKAPLVIRDSGEGTHQIIGPAHVAGAMAGSMMNAGLPSHTYTII